MMEATVFVAPKVQEAFKKFELAALYTDFPNPVEKANLRTQTDVFGGSVIPAYYVIDPATGKRLSEKTGACSEEEFLEFLAKGAK